MIQATKDFIKGIRSMSVGWQLWILGLIAVNMIVPLFFLGSLEAKLVILCFFAGGVFGTYLVKIQGFTKLLGLMHILWFILVPFLLTKIPETSAETPFGLWVRAVILLNSISLIIDTVDVMNYFRGKSN